MDRDLLAVPLHAEDGQHGDWAHVATDSHLEMDPIEIEIDKVDVSQGARCQASTPRAWRT